MEEGGGGGGLNSSQQRRPVSLGKALSVRLLSKGGKLLYCLTFIRKFFKNLSLNHLVSYSWFFSESAGL